MKNRVRYICVPVTSFELADALTELKDKAEFISQVLQMFKSCEAGCDPEPDQTENRVLDIALEGAAREIKKGYDSYIQKMTARSGSKPETGDQPAIDQRSTGDEPAIDNRREEKRKDLFERDIKESSETEGMQGGRPLSEIELQSINSALSYAGISPDSSFYTLARKAGNRITVDAIRKARDERSKSLAYVVKLMTDAMKGAS